MKIKANLLYKPGNFQMDDCQIEKVVELTHEEFCKLKTTPLADQPFIEKNKGCMFSKDGVAHCLLALEYGGSDGVLIESEGYDYPRYAAYVPGMRDIVNAEMDRAADFIVRQNTRKAVNKCWCAYFEDLEQRLGLTIREGTGLDSMLRAALKRRSEVAAVDMHDGCFEITYHSEYVRRLDQFNRSLEDNLPGLRLKDLLPLLKGSMTFLCHEEADTSVLAENLRLLTAAGQEDYDALLNARVASIDNLPDGMEVVLTDVAPEELVRFNEEYDAFMDAERAMGPMM